MLQGSQNTTLRQSLLVVERVEVGDLKLKRNNLQRHGHGIFSDTHRQDMSPEEIVFSFMHKSERRVAYADGYYDSRFSAEVGKWLN